MEESVLRGALHLHSTAGPNATNKAEGERFHQDIE